MQAAGTMGRALGAVFGQAIGDAIGHPVEFKKTHEVVGLDVPNQFTDDTQMFCAIGEAMLEAPPHLDEEKFMAALTRKFVEWRDNPLGGNHRAPGGTCMEGVRKLGAKVPWQKSGALNGKGNGTAMRAGVVGVMYWQDPDYAFRVGCLQSVNTHNNLEAILGGGTVAYLVAAGIAGIDFPTAVSNALILCSKFNDQTVVPMYPKEVPLGDTRGDQSPWRAIAKFGSAFALGTAGLPPADFSKFNGDDFSVVPAVAAGIFYNARYGGEWHETGFGTAGGQHAYNNVVVNAANFGDDADTIAAISGTIAGARCGIDAINGYWVESVELTDYLRGLGNRLWDASLLYKSKTDVHQAEVAEMDQELIGELGDDVNVDPDVLMDFDEIEF